MTDKAKNKKIKELAEKVFSPIIEIIDRNFFVCMETNKGLCPMGADEDAFDICRELVKDLEDKASTYSGGSSVFDAMSGRIGEGEKKATECIDMAKNARGILDLANARKKQIDNVIAEKKKQKSLDDNRALLGMFQ